MAAPWRRNLKAEFFGNACTYVVKLLHTVHCAFTQASPIRACLHCSSHILLYDGIPPGKALNTIKKLQYFLLIHSKILIDKRWVRKSWNFSLATSNNSLLAIHTKKSHYIDIATNSTWKLLAIYIIEESVVCRAMIVYSRWSQMLQ